MLTNQYRINSLQNDRYAELAFHNSKYLNKNALENFEAYIIISLLQDL